MILGEKICEFRFRSFFMAGSLICRMLVLFFRFSKTGWVSLDIDEGVLRILLVELEPKLLGLSEIADDFAYPIQSSSELNKYFEMELVGLYGYKISGIEDGYIGAYFDFGGCGFSVLESEDCLSISDGVVDISENIILFRLEV